MAYNFVERFPSPPKYFPIYDPGTYQFEKNTVKPNTVPFLSKTPRKTGINAILWTQASYNPVSPNKIPNITSLNSTLKRFPYEAFSAEDLEVILCKCETENPCVCSDSKTQLLQEPLCQGKIKRRIFKGQVFGPSRSSGLQQGITERSKYASPPFYDPRVNESTEFYQGCKWSQRSSKRAQQSIKEGPGPGYYFTERQRTEQEICIERLREHKRKTSKQLRFIEKVQQQQILDGRPGPGAYSPEYPRGTCLSFLGPKGARFSSEFPEQPGPTNYRLRRDFDPPEVPKKLCQAMLPEPSCFGMKANRFTAQKETGPSPASYDVSYKPCNIVHCPKTPFGSSAVRFKTDVFEESEDEELFEKDEECSEDEINKTCPTPTWEFKSQTIRMKALVKKCNEPSPADLPQSINRIQRPLKSQYDAPFNSSEGRFQPWYNYTPVFGKLKTPGPCYYNLVTPKPLPAVHHGPLFRARRFPKVNLDTPAPNEYATFGGIETILKTYNSKLTNNIENKLKFHWNPPPEPQTLNFEQREALLIQKCINLLEPDSEHGRKSISSVKHKTKETMDENTEIDGHIKDFTKPKLLRSFLYTQQVPNYF